MITLEDISFNNIVKNQDNNNQDNNNQDNNNQDNNKIKCFSTQIINKEEHDKKCAKYSTMAFLCGVFTIFIWGITNLKPQ